MITRGVLLSVTQTARGFRKLAASLLADEPEDIQHLETHGLHSTPTANAAVVAFQVSGNADHLIGIVAGDYRGPAIQLGDTVVYNDHGWSLRLMEHETSLSDGNTQRLVVTTLGSAGALVGVARKLDAVTISEDFGAWVSSVRAALTTLGYPPPPIDGAIGVITAASTKVFVEAG